MIDCSACWSILENDLAMPLSGDILQGDFNDSYDNLVFKSAAILDHFTNGCSAQYLLKTDDDIFVNVPALTQFLIHHQPQGKPDRFLLLFEGVTIAEGRRLHRMPRSHRKTLQHVLRYETAVAKASATDATLIT